jgi:Hsp20/alpha crystallin family protein
LLLGGLGYEDLRLCPLWRSTVGFDRLFDLLDESQHRTDNYPPYNIERLGEDRYQISLALAGFSPDEIAVTAEQNMLTVEGRKSDKDQHESPSGYLGSAVQTAVQPCRLRPGEDCHIRQWPSPGRTRPRNPGSHEAPANRHRRWRFDRTNHAEGGLSRVWLLMSRADSHGPRVDAINADWSPIAASYAKFDWSHIDERSKKETRHEPG